MARKNPLWIIGIDEVGRGPLAGPVTLCAFAVKREHHGTIEADDRIRDSKKLTPQKRERVAEDLYKLMGEGICRFEITSSSHDIIDRKGIVHAIRIAIASVLKKLAVHPEDADIYLDGSLKAPIRYFRQHTIIKGDDRMRVIAAASILAKVHRDRLMDEYDLKFPNYGFFDNKGYGTAAHMLAIKKHGLTPIHRKTFVK